MIRGASRSAPTRGIGKSQKIIVFQKWYDTKSVLTKPDNASGEEPPVVPLYKGDGSVYVCGLAISDFVLPTYSKVEEETATTAASVCFNAKY